MGILNVFFSKHATLQADARDINQAEVLEAVQKNADKIARMSSRTNEVKVIVKHTKYTVARDGSNGDMIVACVDAKTGTIKTVMYQNQWQVSYKSKETPYVK